MRCGRCSRQDAAPNGRERPVGWEMVTVSGTPNKTMMLCSFCTTMLKWFLHDVMTRVTEPGT